MLHTEANARQEARRVPREPRTVDRRGQHGLRGRRHPAPAGRRLRDRRQDAADLPPDRRPLRARADGGGDRENSWLYLPADPQLRELAATVEDEVQGRAPRARPVRRGRASRTRSEAEPARAAPRSTRRQAGVRAAVGRRRAADEPVRRARAGARRPAPSRPSRAPRTELDEPGTPLYARRAGLRTERQKLVGSLRRITGEPFTQINARINRKAGVTQVEDATVEQLDRSISLLLDELTAARRRGAARR